MPLHNGTYDVCYTAKHLQDKMSVVEIILDLVAEKVAIKTMLGTETTEGVDHGVDLGLGVEGTIHWVLDAG
jgi:hypothetical protein